MIRIDFIFLFFNRAILLSGFALLIFTQQSFGQATGAEGFVVDDATGIDIPYTNVYFLHTSIGTITDSTGRFEIKTFKSVDTLVFSQIGYQKVKLGMKKGVVFHLVVRMKDGNLTLNEVIIKPGVNPAFSIIRQIFNHRKNNDPNRLSQFSTDVYTNISAKFTNINLSETKGNFLKKLNKYLPKETGNSRIGFIPLFYSEKVTKNIVDRENNVSQNQVIAYKENGLGLLKDLQISGYTNSMSTMMNFYDNYVDLFGHNFVSPVGGLGRRFYKYYLSDSTHQKGRVVYTVKFVAKNDKDLTFKGEFTVVKGLWAILEINAILPKVANVNFLNRFDVSYQYQILNDSVSFFKSNTIRATFNYNKLPKAHRSMLEIDKFSTYNNVRIGKAVQMPESMATGKIPSKKKAMFVSDTIFSHYNNLTENISGRQIRQSIDSINNIRWVRFANKVTDMFVTEYYNVGKYEIGPFLNLVQYNNVEGMRLSFGGRTGELFNPDYSIDAMTGYGFKDKQWKYNADFNWKFRTPQRTILQLHMSKDLQLFGVYGHIHLIKENSRLLGEDNFVSAVFKRTQNERRAMFYQTSIDLEHEWFKGFSTELKLENDRIQDNRYVPFIQKGINIGQIRNQAIRLRLRLSWDEKIMDRYLRRYYLGTHYPIINLLGTIGRYEAGNQTGNYYKMHITLRHRFLVGIPMIRYILEAGTLFGKVPFPLLEIHRGNESYGLSRFRFNLLNNATIASDRYFSFMGEMFMNGLIMNRLPLLRQLNIRSVFSVKYLYSELSNKHAQVVNFPWDMNLPGHQYLELGVGITSIFKFLRVDYVWRVIPVNFSPMPKAGIRIRFSVDL